MGEKLKLCRTRLSFVFLSTRTLCKPDELLTSGCCRTDIRDWAPRRRDRRQVRRGIRHVALALVVAPFCASIDLDQELAGLCHILCIVK